MKKTDLNIYKEDFIKTLGEFIKIPSYIQDIKDYPTKEMKQILMLFQEKATSFGFKTKIDPKSHWGYCEIGEGEELIGILGHLDVVAPGDLDTWDSDPFTLRVAKDNTTIFGRGVGDDKGPVVLSLYVLKAILDSGVKLNKRIRIIVGTDEESLWRGIGEYLKTEEKPKIAYTPDSKFPFTYVEKELWQYNIRGPKWLNKNKFKYGKGYNSVPDSVTYKGEEWQAVTANAINKGYKIKRLVNGVEFIGKTIHAKDADKGESAILNFINSLPKSLDHPMVKFIKDNFGQGMAKKIFGVVKDKDSGILTANIGVLDFNGKETMIGIDSRIPVSSDSVTLSDLIDEKAQEYGLSYERYDTLKKVYMPLDSKIIKDMTSSYEKITGEKAVPLKSGGATYARALDNCIAFGPKFPDEKSNEHQSNEISDINNYLKAGEIYIDFLLNQLKN